MRKSEGWLTAAPKLKRECFAKSLGDCDGGLSREHFLSRAILERLNINGQLKASGYEHYKGESRSASPNELVARILCRHHNSALSDLDAEADRLFAATDALDRIARAAAAPKPLAFDGHLIERFLLKVLCGIVAAGQVRRKDNDDVVGEKATRDVPVQWVRVLFGRESQTRGLGLFLDRAVSTRMHPGVGWEPVLGPQLDIGGLLLDMNRIRLSYWTLPIGEKWHATKAGSVYRPSRLQFARADGVVLQELRLKWRTPMHFAGTVTFECAEDVP